MKHEVLEYLLAQIKRRYGDLSNDAGCYINGHWLSVNAIVDLIDQADRSC